MSNDIFDDQKPADQLEKKEVKQDPNPNTALDALMAITNQDGSPKYNSLEEGIKALANSQVYIPTLQSQLDAKEAELAELKAKQESSESVEEVVSKLLKEREAPKETTDQQVPQGLDEASVAKLIREETTRMAQESSAAENRASVAKALQDQFGEKAQEEIAKKASELGLTPDKIGQLAMESPKAVLSLFSVTANNAAPVTQGDVNTSGFQQAKHEELAAPEKSLLSGASSKDQAEFMRKVREDVYKKLGVNT